MSRPKGQKLGPRKKDNWQIQIDFLKSQGKLDEAEKMEFVRYFRKKNMEFIEPYIENYGEKAGFVYVLKTVQDPPVYKIGKTRSLRSRTNLLNTQFGFEVEFILIKKTDDCDLVEKLLHALFKDKNARNIDWFWLDEKDLEQLRIYLK